MALRTSGLCIYSRVSRVQLVDSGDVHLLAIFPMETSESDIDRLLGAVGITAGSAVTTKPFEKVVKEIVDAKEPFAKPLTGKH